MPTTHYITWVSPHPQRQSTICCLSWYIWRWQCLWGRWRWWGRGIFYNYVRTICRIAQCGRTFCLVEWRQVLMVVTMRWVSSMTGIIALLRLLLLSQTGISFRYLLMSSSCHLLAVGQRRPPWTLPPLYTLLSYNLSALLSPSRWWIAPFLLRRNCMVKLKDRPLTASSLRWIMHYILDPFIALNINLCSIILYFMLFFIRIISKSTIIYVKSQFK